MRYALIADIHANLPALDAVLAAIEPSTPIYHLGDLVGYAPWPNEVISRLREREIPGIAGNYDSTVATSYKHCGCKYEDQRQEALSHQSYEWTLRNVSHESKAYLGQLPFRIDLRPNGGHLVGQTMILVHGNHALNTVYVTEDRPDSFLQRMAESLGARAGDVVCFGHTHVPWHRQVEGVHFVNAGSVGRPKDGDWRAGYVVIDVNGSDVNAEFERVDYDLAATERAIIDSELPNEFAEFLRHGGTPATSSTSS